MTEKKASSQDSEQPIDQLVPQQPPPGQSGSNTPVNTPSTPGQASTSVNADLNHISGGSTVTVAGQNVINIRIDTPAQARDIIKTIREEEIARQRPTPPPADATVQEKVNHWFKNDLNNDQQRFFVITLALFNGLRYADFKDGYEIVIETMKVKNDNEKKKIRSYFDDSDFELINKARAEIIREQGGLEEILKFSEPEYESAVIQCLRDGYRNVLLDLLPALKQIGENSNWEIRSRAAEAVAEIGKMGFFRVRSQVLELWSRDQRPYVRAAVGYALSRLYNDQNMRTAVNDLLNNWSDLEQPWSDADWAWRVRWTAASVYKQIGLKDPETAFVGLKRIARHDNIRIADAVIHTLVVLSLQGHLESVICTLGDWVAEGTGGREPEIICEVAIFAFAVLANIHAGVSDEEDVVDRQSDEFKAKSENFFELVREGASERSKVWQAVVGLGVYALEHKLFDPYFAVIELWVEPALRENRLRDVLCDLLVEVFQAVRPEYVNRIISQILFFPPVQARELLKKVLVEEEKSRDSSNKLPHNVLRYDRETLLFFDSKSVVHNSHIGSTPFSKYFANKDDADIYTSRRSLRVFLCYSKEDKTVVWQLYRQLMIENGIDPWLDEEKIMPGDNRDIEIKKSMKASDVIIVCLSRSLIAQEGYVHKEISLALDIAKEKPEDTIFIVPLKLDECPMPERLSHWQPANFFEDNAYEKLMRALHKRAYQLGIKSSDA